MTGVEILSQRNIYVIEYPWWILAIFTAIGLIVGLVLTIYWSFKYKERFGSFHIGIMLLFTIGGAFMGLLATSICKYETDVVDYIEYKVAVSDDVGFNEFMDKYEILDREGKIYTVKERE